MQTELASCQHSPMELKDPASSAREDTRANGGQAAGRTRKGRAATFTRWWQIRVRRREVALQFSFHGILFRAARFALEEATNTPAMETTARRWRSAASARGEPAWRRVDQLGCDIYHGPGPREGESIQFSTRGVVRASLGARAMSECLRSLWSWVSSARHMSRRCKERIISVPRHFYQIAIPLSHKRTNPPHPTYGVLRCIFLRVGNSYS